MSKSNQDAAGQSGEVAIGTEHQVQVGLARALENALRAGDRDGNAAEILDQLTVFTNAHFLSEQLLMRLHSYADYDTHCQEHDALIEALSALQKDFDAQSTDERLRAVRVFAERISRHIAGSDQALERFVSETPRP